MLVSYRSLAPKNFHRYYRARRLRQTRPRAFIYVIPNATLLTIHWIDPAAACEYSYLLSALIKTARGFDNALTMPERLDKATRRREPVRAFLHYVEKLSKAKRRGANPRKIAKLGRKVAKYSARAAGAPQPASAAAPRKTQTIGPQGRTSRFVGVSWYAASSKWRATVKVGGQRVHIGYYFDEEAAARAYNAHVTREGLAAELNTFDASGALVAKAESTSRFVGVCWHRRSKQWQVRYRDASTPPKKKHVGYYADDEKAALAYNKAVSDAGLAGVRELNRVDASGRPVPKSRAAQFTVTIHGGRD